MAWRHIRRSGFTAFWLNFGGLTEYSFINIPVALRLSSIIISSCNNPSSSFLCLLSSVGSSPSFVALFSFIIHFTPLFFLRCHLASSSLSWCTLNSMIPTRWRSVVKAVVINHVIFAARRLFQLRGTSYNKRTELMAGASPRCVLLVKLVKFKMFDLGACKIPLWGPR